MTYSNDAGHQHTAIVIKPDLLLKSKWGDKKIYTHALLEVPKCYGDPGNVYSPPRNSNDIVRLLMMYHPRLLTSGPDT